MFSHNGVYFRIDYTMTEFKRRRGSKTFIFHRRTTIATAYTDRKPKDAKVSTEELPVLGIGIAHCSEKDNFNRAAGRRLALLRCMKALKWDKKTREVFWEEYNKKFK